MAANTYVSLGLLPEALLLYEQALALDATEEKVAHLVRSLTQLQKSTRAANKTSYAQFKKSQLPNQNYLAALEGTAGRLVIVKKLDTFAARDASLAVGVAANPVDRAGQAQRGLPSASSLVHEAAVRHKFGGGRGLFASMSLTQGQAVFSEHPLVTTRPTPTPTPAPSASTSSPAAVLQALPASCDHCGKLLAASSSTSSSAVDPVTSAFSCPRPLCSADYCSTACRSFAYMQYHAVLCGGVEERLCVVLPEQCHIVIRMYAQLLQDALRERLDAEDSSSFSTPALASTDNTSTNGHARLGLYTHLESLQHCSAKQLFHLLFENKEDSWKAFLLETKRVKEEKASKAIVVEKLAAARQGAVVEEEDERDGAVSAVTEESTKGNKTEEEGGAGTNSEQTLTMQAWQEFSRLLEQWHALILAELKSSVEVVSLKKEKEGGDAEEERQTWVYSLFPTDLLVRCLSILHLNSCRGGHGEQQLFPLVAHANHSCKPNITVSSSSSAAAAPSSLSSSAGNMRVTALEGIEEGEQLFMVCLLLPSFLPSLVSFLCFLVGGCVMIVFFNAGMAFHSPA